MPLEAGKLDKRILVERDVPTRDDHGNDVSKWILLASPWAEVAYGTGRERREAAQDRGALVGTFNIRKTPTTAGITPLDRVVWNSFVWDIAGVAPLELDGISITATTSYELVTRALSGAIGAGGLLTGDLYVGPLMAGLLAASAGLSGSLTVSSQLAGAIAGRGGMTGDVTVAALLAGTIGAIGALTGGLTVTAALAGTASARAGAIGAITITAALSGAAAGVGNLAGNVTVAASLAGTASAAAASTGNITVAAALAGTVASSGALTGNVTVAALLAVTIAGRGGLTGDVTVAAALAGTAAARGTIIGDIAVTIPLAGSVSSSAALAGDVTLGINLISNGSFDDSSGWTLTGVTSISGGKLLFSPADISDTGTASRDANATVSEGYFYTLTGVLAGVDGQSDFSIGGGASLTRSSGSGAFALNIRAGSTQSFLFSGHTSTAGFNVDDLILAPYTTALNTELCRNGGFDDTSIWGLVGSNTSISGGVFGATRGAGTKQAFQSSAVPLNPGTYRVIYTLVSRSAGSIFVEVCGKSTTARTAPATYTEDITVAAADTVNQQIIVLAVSSANFTVDDVSVKKVA